MIFAKFISYYKLVCATIIIIKKTNFQSHTTKTIMDGPKQIKTEARQKTAEQKEDEKKELEMQEKRKNYKNKMKCVYISILLELIGQREI